MRKGNAFGLFWSEGADGKKFDVEECPEPGIHHLVFNNPGE
jgi:hypothetical protein